MKISARRSLFFVLTVALLALCAASAFARYGRGRHRASLNFGDCLAYATAVTAGDTLLFVGDDFKHTDVRVA